KARPATAERADVEHNLPTALTPIVGRSDAIALLTKSIADHRLVTVLGPGGIGKTTVALAVARQFLTSFAEGVRFVDFSSLAEPRLVASVLASTLRIGVGSDDPLAGMLAHLRGKAHLDRVGT